MQAVTGAARGIGRGIALQLGQAGATVYIMGRTAANLGECAREIKDLTLIIHSLCSMLITATGHSIAFYWKGNVNYFLIQFGETSKKKRII